MFVFRNILILIITLISIFLINCSKSSDTWGNKVTTIKQTQAEYLENFFKSRMEVNKGFISKGDPISYTRVTFYPSDSPDKAILFVEQGWNPSIFDPIYIHGSSFAEEGSLIPTPPQPEPKIKNQVDFLLQQFTECLYTKSIKDILHFNDLPQNHIIIRHCPDSSRSDDGPSYTYAVTINGHTYFKDKEKAIYAKKIVEGLGGIWNGTVLEKSIEESHY